MKIKLSKCEHMDDWYTIVRADHDGRSWMQPMGNNALSFMSSERLIPDACIEGDASEMIHIAKAIKARTSESFKRCAVHFEADGAHFCSPRNSSMDAVIPVEYADEFADQVLRELAPPAAISSLPPSPPGQPEGHHVLTTNSLDGQNSANLAIKSGQPEGCELPEESESACTLTDEELTDPVFVRAYMESHMALFDGIMRDNVRLRAALAPRQAPAEPNQDAARLDFVLDRQAFICTIPASQAVTGSECYQLMEQDEDEDFHAISGEGVAYKTKREAIDAAMEAQEKGPEQ